MADADTMLDCALDKARVRRAFARALVSYDANADVQHRMARELAARIASLGDARYRRVFEFGCGTGLLTRLLAGTIEYEEYYLNDIVTECAALAAKIPNSLFIGCDVEALEAFPPALDLVVSNAVFQWLSDPAKVLERMAESMVPGGVLAFTTFGPGNVSEVGQIRGVSLDYSDQAELDAMVSRSFQSVETHRWECVMHFESPEEVLRHLKLTGATGLEGGRWTRRDLEDFSQAYRERFTDPEGVRLTYKPILVVARAAG